MKQCLIACRSLTYAQRSARVLENAGYSANIMRMPADLLESGCGYAVKINETHLADGVILLRENGFTPKRAFVTDRDGRLTEVCL